MKIVRRNSILSLKVNKLRLRCDLLVQNSKRVFIKKGGFIIGSKLSVDKLFDPSNLILFLFYLVILLD